MTFIASFTTSVLRSVADWFAGLAATETATASHEAGGHHYLGSYTSSFVSSRYWPEAARHID